MANENNIFQQLIKPVTPKVLAEERVYVYVPQASTKTKGIASYDDSQFQLDNGHVKIKLNDPTTTPSLVQVDKDDFVYSEGIVKINWPYAHDKSGSTRTNGYGLIKIADNSQDYLKYTDNGLLAVDISKLDIKNASADSVKNKLDKSFTTEKSTIVLNYEDESGYGSFSINSADNLEDPTTFSIIGTGFDEGKSYILLMNTTNDVSQILMKDGKIDIQASNGLYVNGDKLDISQYVNTTTDQNVKGIKNFIDGLMVNGKNVVVQEVQTTLSDGTIITSDIDNNSAAGGAININVSSTKDNVDLYSNALMVNASGTLFHSINEQTNDEKLVYIGVEGAGKYNKNDGTIDNFATELYTQNYVNTKIDDITSIKIRNVDQTAIEATAETVQTVATNYIVEKLGRQPKDYDGLFITMTDSGNDIVEWAYFGTGWVSVGSNDIDLSDYVDLASTQTIDGNKTFSNKSQVTFWNRPLIHTPSGVYNLFPADFSNNSWTGDNNFLGKLQHNGVDVATTREAQKMIILGADGVEETQAYSFTVQDASSYLPYRSNGTKFLVDLHLPVSGDLTTTKKVAITFGDTTYYVYNILKGGEAITIGDLHQVDKYNNETGYRFISEMIFFQTSDLTGFYIVPTVSMSDILALDSDEMDDYIADGGLTQGQLAICSKVINNGYTAGALYRFDITYPTTYTWTELAGTGGGLTVLTGSDFPLSADLLAKVKANPQNYCYTHNNKTYLYSHFDSSFNRIYYNNYEAFGYWLSVNDTRLGYSGFYIDDKGKGQNTNEVYLFGETGNIEIGTGSTAKHIKAIGVFAKTNNQNITGDDLYLATTIRRYSD